MHKKIIAVTLLLTITMTVMTACLPTAKKDIEQTNKELSIAMYGSNFAMDILLEMYKTKYPNVTVNANMMTATAGNDPSQFYSAIFTEIMSGKGPDVIFMDRIFMNQGSVYKMLQSGVFEDLTSYFDDSNFDLIDYNSTVFNGGIIDGKRYIIPAQYTIPILKTTTKMLEKTGFDISKNTDFFAFTEQAEKSLGNEDPLLVHYKEGLVDYIMLAGIAEVDYKTNKINIDKEAAQKAAQLYKSMYQQFTYYEKNKETELSQLGMLFGCEGFPAETMLFTHYRGNPVNAPILEASVLYGMDYDSIFTPVFDVDGQVQAEILECYAVNSSSANKQNAVDFIKLAISEDFLSNEFVQNRAIPINNKSVHRDLSMYQSSKTKVGMTGYDSSLFVGCSPDVITQYENAIARVGGAYIDQDWIKIFNKNMQPFYDDKMDFEQAYDNAVKAVDVFLQE